MPELPTTDNIAETTTNKRLIFTTQVRWLSKPEAAAYLTMSERKFDDWCKDNRIPRRRMVPGNPKSRLIYDIQHLDKAMEAQVEED